MVSVKGIIEFLIGLFVLPILMGFVFILGAGYFNFLYAEVVFYGPLVLEGIIGLILLKYRKIISYGIFLNMAFTIVRNFIL